MQINQTSLFGFGEEKIMGKVTKPSKLAKEIARPFKCVLCGKMVSNLEGDMCTDCYCDKLAKRK